MYSKTLVPEKMQGDINGALNGKTVFLSPGHGWDYYTNLSKWSTQRSPQLGIVEDDLNTEIVSYFLVPYFKNAGAEVFSVREYDRNPGMVIIDDNDYDNYIYDGFYNETGDWIKSDDGTSYGRITFPVNQGVNVLKNGSYKTALTGTGASASWIPDIPEDGYYHIYVSYVSFEESAKDAVYTINHSGGTTEVKVDQSRRGGMWIDIGRYHFNKGSFSEKGSVVLNRDDSGATGKIIAADAVRFGGGTGVINMGVKTSGVPRWEEAAIPHIQFSGAPAETYFDITDPVARAKYTGWVNQEGDDSIYISLHSNYSQSTLGKGLMTIIYGPNLLTDNLYLTDHAAEGSNKLAEMIHARIMNSVNEHYDSAWTQVGSGLYSASFSELNPSLNDVVPSCMIELAYMTNPDDNLKLRDPRFRDIAARAVYQATVQYFADKADVDPVFLPSPPQNIMTKTNENGTVTVSWEDSPADENFYLGHPATGYVVRTSLNGYGFNDGVDVGNVNQFTFEGLEQGVPVFFKVVAYNDGGYSFPTATAGAVPKKSGAQILIVDGYERIDLPRFSVPDDQSRRYLLEYINSYNYIIQYLEVFGELDFPVDFIQKPNLSIIDLSKYEAVVWFSGKQATEDETFTISEQGIIAQYIFDGGGFFVSGSEIGWDLVGRGNTEYIVFFNDVLNAHFVTDSSGVYTYYGIDDFSKINGFFDDGTNIYQVNYPDVIEPYNESGKNILFYDTERTVGAGVLTVTGKKVAILGFPFETILEKNNRIGIMEKVFEKFEITPT
ncbi:MAG TPA: N-acetylmuramoyl-L-alanine amidase [bacterium]|nr:N-acetylmuramoyl-L-alanine amidase [bacterium]